MKIDPKTGLQTDKARSVEDVRKSLERTSLQDVAPGDEVGKARAKKKARNNAPGMHALLLAMEQVTGRKLL